jgi:murein DD-endopeptidase MepM/ murein hydrolase activator NlpD
MGDIQAVPADTTYELPFAPGQAFKISQGYDGRFSHTGAFAYSLDFDLPEGTPVYAAREGIVVAVQVSYQAGRADRSLTDKANCITVLPPDGTFVQYAHLRYGGSLVELGQQVERGQMIGYSGNTGFTSGPHMHFHVYRVLNVNGDWETLPTRFATSEGTLRLLEGQVYTRPQMPNAQR